jgi:hypothetical protein
VSVWRGSPPAQTFYPWRPVVAENKESAGVSQATFFNVVAQIFVAMFLVLVVSGRPEADWFRLLVMVMLAALTLLYAGVAVWLRFRKNASAGPTA